METTTINISSREPAPNHPVGSQQLRALLRRQLLLLLGCVPLSLVPFFVPEHLIQSLPRFGVVSYYVALSLVAGWFGINWLWKMARIVLATDNKKHLPDARIDTAG